ncbi:proteophosphoglycan 5 [Streptomyces sp. NPDC058572]|uniref:proteophosphoglycan 5 n=1 Tax=Streptomyces sp. NPDC058572 TaxID=3346546 RepID=UPI00365F2E89
MGLVTLNLPAPEQLRGRWAACAAICAARGRGGTCWADGPGWHFDDSGGNWAEVHHLGAGRAVLIGHDHEYSETYYGPAADVFGEDGTDVLAAAPDWWRPVVERILDAKEYVGFVYGYDMDGWRRADYSAEDGFHSVGLPALSIEKTRESILAWAGSAPGRSGAIPSPDAVEALIAADGDVTEAHVSAVIGEGGWGAAAGAAAARKFLAA